jgi:hypothetical protein
MSHWDLFKAILYGGTKCHQNQGILCLAWIKLSILGFDRKFSLAQLSTHLDNPGVEIPHQHLRRSVPALGLRHSAQPFMPKVKRKNGRVAPAVLINAASADPL